MKISETITRECCDPKKDLREYAGDMDAAVCRFTPEYCVHCGQIWVHDSEMGPAGDYDPVAKKVRIKIDSW